MDAAVLFLAPERIRCLAERLTREPGFAFVGKPFCIRKRLIDNVAEIPLCPSAGDFLLINKAVASFGVSLTSCIIAHIWTFWPAPLMLLTKPCRDAQYDQKPSHDADSRATLRSRVHRIYLPAPFEAPSRVEMQTGLSRGALAVIGDNRRHDHGGRRRGNGFGRAW
jgi:hypothetical protein